MKKNGLESKSGLYHVKQIGIIYPHNFKNRCCEDKPFLLMAMFSDEGNPANASAACGILLHIAAPHRPLWNTS